MPGKPVGHTEDECNAEQIAVETLDRGWFEIKSGDTRQGFVPKEERWAWECGGFGGSGNHSRIVGAKYVEVYMLGSGIYWDAFDSAGNPASARDSVADVIVRIEEDYGLPKGAIRMVDPNGKEYPANSLFTQLLPGWGNKE